MSTHGIRRTPLFELSVQHVIDMDDFGGPPNPLHSHIDVFVRVWSREFDLSFRKPRKRFYINRYGDGNIPHLFGFHVSTDTFPTHQYSGDFRENWKDDSYYGQKPR